MAFYKDGLRFSCTGCGRCCHTHGDYAYVYFADKDIEAACTYLNMPRIDFLNAYCVTDDHHMVHLTMNDGRCNFLDDQNLCAIYPVRPMQCRTWPFWTENLENEKEWYGAISACCPGIGRGRVYSREEVASIARQRDCWYGIDF